MPTAFVATATALQGKMTNKENFNLKRPFLQQGHSFIDPPGVGARASIHQSLLGKGLTEEERAARLRDVASDVPQRQREGIYGLGPERSPEFLGVLEAGFEMLLHSDDAESFLAAAPLLARDHFNVVHTRCEKILNNEQHQPRHSVVLALARIPFPYMEAAMHEIMQLQDGGPARVQGISIMCDDIDRVARLRLLVASPELA